MDIYNYPIFPLKWSYILQRWILSWQNGSDVISRLMHGILHMAIQTSFLSSFLACLAFVKQFV